MAGNRWPAGTRWGELLHEPFLRGSRAGVWECNGEVRLIYTRFFLPHLAWLPPSAGPSMAGEGNNGRYLNPKFNVTDIRGERA